MMENEKLNMMALEDDALEGVNGGRTVLHVKRGTLELHSKASGSSSTIMILDRGDNLVCVGEAKRDSHDKTWIKVRVNGTTGWVRGDKVK